MEGVPFLQVAGRNSLTSYFQQGTFTKSMKRPFFPALFIATHRPLAAGATHSSTNQLLVAANADLLVFRLWWLSHDHQWLLLQNECSCNKENGLSFGIFETDLLCIAYTCFQIFTSHQMMTNADIPFKLIGLARTVDFVLLPVRYLVLFGTVVDIVAG